MPFGTLESVAPNLVRMPKYLRGPNLGRFIRSHAAVMDGNLEALRQGLALSNPLLCPVEQLPQISKDRALPIFDNEPEWSKRQTLASWMQLHRFRGSSRGRIMRLRNFFLGTDGKGSIPTIYAVHRYPDVTTWHWITPAGRYHYNSDNDNFQVKDGDGAKWSQTSIIIEMTETDYDTPPLYGDGHTYGGGALYGVGSPNGLPAAAHADLVKMAKWGGAAHAWLTFLILNWGAPIDITAAPVQDADGWWSLPNGKWWHSVDPTTGLGTRPPTMQFIHSNIP